MKIKSINNVFLFLLFLFSSYQLITAEQQGSSFLWEVKLKSDTSKVAYLLGSIHIATPDMYPLSPAIMAAWKKSEVLAVEVNLLDYDPMSMLGDQALLSKIVYISGGSLDSALPANTCSRVKKYLTKMGLDETIASKFTPLGAAIMIEMGDMFPDMLNPDANKLETLVDGIDTYFMNLAKEEHKKIVEVESIKEQINVFETLNKHIVSYIESLLDKLDKQATEGNNESQQIFTAWKEGNVKMLTDMMSAPMSDDKAVDNALKHALLYSRNEKMTNKIETYIKGTDTCFIVLGAGHYVGEKSIIELLTKSNKYTIRRL